MEARRWVTPENGFSELGNGAANGLARGSGEGGVLGFRPVMPLSPTSPGASSSSSPGMVEGCILHRVSMKDTLAGVAIKYGVEVADIKRINGLSTDLQMFAHKTIRIPCPGRHPPTHLPNGSADDREHTPPRRQQNDILGTLGLLRPPRHNVTPAMSLLHGYYGLGPQQKVDSISEGTEMSVYRKGKSICFDNEAYLMEPPNTDPLANRHRKSRSLVGPSSMENGDDVNERLNSDSSDTEVSVRRRQRADLSPELLRRRESSSAFSAGSGKGLALRPKSSSRADLNKSQVNLSSTGDSSFDDGLIFVKKSSSTSDLQESDVGMSSSIWPAGRWPIKPEAFAPLLDSIPNPIASWRNNKAALD